MLEEEKRERALLKGGVSAIFFKIKESSRMYSG